MYFPKFLKSDQSRFVFSLLILTTCIYLIVLWYSYIFEQDKLAVDRYNFEQLEKAKPILTQIPKDTKNLSTLKEFNDIYRVNIKPIKNCYYVRNDNWSKPYIFWFQLESLISKFVYFWSYYAYPKYDLPYQQVCVWGGWCYDHYKYLFKWTISHPCEEN